MLTAHNEVLIDTLPDAEHCSTIVTVALRHADIANEVWETHPAPINTIHAGLGNTLMQDTAVSGPVSLAIHLTFDSSNRAHPRIVIAMRRQGLGGRRLGPLQQFWQTVYDYMAADCTSALLRAIERAIADFADKLEAS